MSIAGCYSLDLYCEHDDCLETNIKDFRVEDMKAFAGYDRGETFRKARRAGWLINWKEDKALCPIHSGKGTNKP